MEMRKLFGTLLIGCFVTLLSITVIQLVDVREDLSALKRTNQPNLDTSLLQLPQTSLILDRNEQPIYEYRVPYRRSIRLEEMPLLLQQLFIQSEDQLFYQHKGFDLTAITRAFILNAKHSGIEQGGSTITQQLVRNVYLNHEQTYSRKMNELLLSYQVEKEFTKDEILEFYLNAIYFANQAYGVEAASQTYFSKSVGELSPAEMAFIAAIPNNPTLYDPYKNYEKTKERQERLLSILAEQEVISYEEAEKSKKEKITLAKPKEYASYANYLSFVERELKDLIQISYGLTDDTEANQKVIEEKVTHVLQQGIKVHTYLDPNAQVKAEKALEVLSSRPNLQGASVVINHKEKSILALTGGVNYSKGDFHRAYQAVRQPGSTIKPLLSFAPYIERKNSSIYDSVNARSICFTPTYCPSNYGGAKYGAVTLTTALSKSINTAAVKLLSEVTPAEAFKDLSTFDFQHVTEEDMRLTAALGGFSYGVTPLELTRAYTIFSTNAYVPARVIEKVTDLNGTILYAWDDQPKTVWSDETVAKTRELLVNVVTNGTARRLYSSSVERGGKTGTTNDYVDFWYVGFQGDFTAGVWVGKDLPENIKRYEKEQLAVKIWEQSIPK